MNKNSNKDKIMTVDKNTYQYLSKIHRALCGYERFQKTNHDNFFDEAIFKD